MRIRFALLAFTGLLALTGHAAAQSGTTISAGNINVVQNGSGNTEPEVTLTTTASVNQFQVVQVGSSRGDYTVQIGGATTGNAANGVLISSVSQNGRDNALAPNVGGTIGTSGVIYSTSAVAGSTDALFIPIHVANVTTGSLETNVNVSAAYFRFSDGWIGGYARNAANNAVYTDANSTFSPGVSIAGGQVSNPSANGLTTLNLTGVAGAPVNASQNGVLLVVGAKNEDNYALSRANNDGTFTIIAKGNNSNGTGGENDPVAFVYIPQNTTGLTSGRVLGDGSLVAAVGSSGAGLATSTVLGTGQFLLKIAGVQSADAGVLVISAEGGGTNNVDNIVTYEWSNAQQGWIIESRDLGVLTASPPLESLTPTEGAYSFAFVPVPEPTSILGLCTLGAGIVGFARRKLRVRA